jgi:hypothetical protein
MRVGKVNSTTVVALTQEMSAIAGGTRNSRGFSSFFNRRSAQAPRLGPEFRDLSASSQHGAHVFNRGKQDNSANGIHAGGSLEHH